MLFYSKKNMKTSSLKKKIFSNEEWWGIYQKYLLMQIHGKKQHHQIEMPQTCNILVNINSIFQNPWLLKNYTIFLTFQKNLAKIKFCTVSSRAFKRHFPKIFQFWSFIDFVFCKTVVTWPIFLDLAKIKFCTVISRTFKALFPKIFQFWVFVEPIFCKTVVI
ncbi:hypothetical protein [Mesomycoplasma ovipneumoniae]|uniref:hypothetical protein n=2 Tax=Mesomycoplasma ovipneumoniae TaxID=29562 RepID=UPI0029643689|nr:hypothetical protein [Mesomycoplasma ovipneumoniae]